MRGGGRALPVQRRGLRCYLYMVAAMWGTVCVLLVVCLVLFIRRCRRAGT